jgi:predicted transcriptional regulator of viral defense system
MIISNNILMESYAEYSNKNAKISREMRNGNLIKIINGLYETNPNIPGYYLATSIYGPSYLSFDFALSYYGLIPEKVTTYTSATFDKKKKKEYSNQFGYYTYRDVPFEVYPLGVRVMEENGYTYQIATAEKALCDKLYTLSPLKNYTELENLLFVDLRIDIEEFNKLNVEDIKIISELYHSTNVDMLYRYMRRNAHE